MALAASRTFLVLFVTFCTPGCGWAAEKLVRPPNGKTTSVDRGGRDSWERTIHLDGRPVDRYTIGSGKLARPHRLLIGAKGSSSPLVEEAVDPEWVNLDGFAVMGTAAASNSSTGPGRARQSIFRKQPSVVRAARVDRTTYPSRASGSGTNRRTPLQSAGPRQTQGALARIRLLERRRQHHTKPQSDQRNTNTHILTSESVHVVSLQALKTPGQTTLGNKAISPKTTPEPVEYEAQDVSVRVMSPQSVLVSWVDPVLETGRVNSQVARSYTVRYREKGESARWEYKESHQRRVLIDTLTADSMYEFSVRISEGTNDGKWSISVFQRTPESAPSGPPENFEVKPLRGKGTAVKATWDPPEEPNGRIKEYILSYAPALKPFGLKTVTYRGTTTTATIEGLTPGDRYIFKIRATNRRGQGPQSKAISIAIPGSSSTVSSFTKNKDSHKINPSKQDSNHDESDLQSTQVQEERSAGPQPPSAVPTNRRTRPLSQTRSYHSIFSSLRGSVRNTGNRGSSRGKIQDRENDEEEEEVEEEEEEEIPTTQPPIEETAEVKLTTKQPENNVSPESEDEVEYDEDQWTTETPSLKIVTPSPTKKVSRASDLSRSSIKIRVHQKPGIKPASSSTSSSSSDSLSSTSFSTLSSMPSKNALSTSNTQESTASEKDYPVSTSPESKKTYDKPSTTYTKPSMSGVNNANTQQTNATSVGKGSTSVGRPNGSGFGSRYSYGRRHPGILSRGNSTRILNGYKPAITSQANLPRTSLTSRGSTSQSTLPDRTQTHKMTETIISSTTKSPSQIATQSPEKSHRYNFEITKSHGPTTLQTSRSSSNHPTTVKTSESSQPSLHKAHNRQNSHKPTEQHTTFEEENEDAELAKAAEPALSSKPQPTEHERKVEKGREESSNKKPAFTPNRVSASFAERFPWLANRYPIRLSPGKGVSPAPSRPDGRTPTTRMSSSSGPGTPIGRGSTTRISGATGAVGVSRIQETAEDLRNSSTHDSIKNVMGPNSVKPSFTERNTATSESRIPSTSSPLSSTSSSTTTLKPVMRPSSNGRDSHERNHSESSSDSNNDHNGEYLKSSENVGKIDTGADPISAEKKPNIPSADPRRNLEDRRTMANPSRTSSGSTSGVTSVNGHPVGANRRGQHPLLANRQFGGSRFPIRMQQGENSRLGSSSSHSSSSSSVPQPDQTSDHAISNGNTMTKTGKFVSSNSQSATSSSASSSSARDSFRGQAFRNRQLSLRGKLANGGQYKPGNGNGRNGRPNLTATNEKDSSHRGISKAVGQKSITGPDGTKWVVDLEQGVLMNQDGKILQDSQGKPKRVVLGEDGRTIFDIMGSPLINQEGMALFGHGRDSRPVVNPKEKLLMVGGKPVLGLDLPHLRTTTTTTTAPTTTPELTTTEWTTEETTAPLQFPTCPPGTFSRTDEYGNPVLDLDGVLDCYPEDESSGVETDPIVTATMVAGALALIEDELFAQTTQQPTTTMATTTTITTTTTTTSTTTEISTMMPDSTSHNNSPSSEYDLSGKKRFTAAYVNYIRKDPGAPCSLTEALEYLQVDVLEDLIKNDSLAANQVPPKHKPHNLTVVAMEGCHSFIILDWARPLKDDMVSGYMVYSASYDDVLNNKWSSRLSSGTHLPFENLKPNSRYYFKVQAKNVFGLGPISETLSYVTESDDPLLIERPPGGEPIWVPFKFKYNSAHSSCKGSQYVKRTWYRKFVGVVLCNSLRYKIFMGNGLREPFYSIGDTFGQGEDHCQFVDSYRDGRTGPAYLSHNLPSAHGFYRAYRQEPVTFGIIGRRTRHPFVGWYECGVPIPGKW